MADGIKLNAPTVVGGKDVETTELSNGRQLESVRVGKIVAGAFVAIDPLTDTELRASSVPVSLSALAAWSHDQIAVGLAAVQLAAAPLSSRKTIAVIAMCTSSTPIVYIGSSNAVTTANGWPLSNGASLSLDLEPGAEVWAISDIAGQRAAYAEIA